MIYMVTLVGLLLICINLACMYQKQDVIRIVVLAITGNILLYVLNSGILFWMDHFSIIGTEVLLIVEMSIILVVQLMRGKRPTCSFDWHKCIIPLIVFLLACPVVIQKFGFFGMGQDQGVYQTKAIALISGNNSNVYNLEELDDLSEEQQDVYKTGISEQYGFYFLNGPQDGPGEGVFHGINTYPALLAWWGSMFGYEQMAGIHTIMLACALFLIYYIGAEVGISAVGQGVITALYALSPVVLWVNKSTLSENVTILIFLMFLYLLLEKEESHRWMIGIPIAVYAFFHVMIYVMMPMFVIVLIMAYLLTGKKSYLIANMIAAVSYRLGYFMMMATAAAYTEGNYDFIERYGIKTASVPKVATLAVLAVIVISVVLLLKPYEKLSMKKLTQKKWIRIAFNWCIRLGILFCTYIGYRYIKHSVYPYANATMYAFLSATVVVIIPFILFVLFFMTRTIYSRKEIVLLTVVYLYCGLFYPTVLSPYVIYYNYYSRYITVYFAIVFILAALLMETLLHQYQAYKNRKQSVSTQTEAMAGQKGYLRRNIGIHAVYGVVLILAVLLYARYDIFMINHMDETRVDWSMVRKVDQAVTDQDALIVDGDLKNQLFYTTKLMSGNTAYPVMDNLKVTVDLAAKKSKKVYYASISPLDQHAMNQANMELVDCIDDQTYSYEKDHIKNGKLPYPLKEERTSSKVYLYCARR